jgi:hypothetical protein
MYATGASGAMARAMKGNCRNTYRPARTGRKQQASPSERAHIAHMRQMHVVRYVVHTVIQWKQVRACMLLL